MRLGSLRLPAAAIARYRSAVNNATDGYRTMAQRT